MLAQTPGEDARSGAGRAHNENRPVFIAAVRYVLPGHSAEEI